MRLINLEKAIECAKEKDYIKTSEQEKAVREVFELAEVQAVPIEVLKELRAEIDREGDYYDTNVDQDIAKGLYKAVQIIDRKISEVSE